MDFVWLFAIAFMTKLQNSKWGLSDIPNSCLFRKPRNVHGEFYRSGRGLQESGKTYLEVKVAWGARRAKPLWAQWSHCKGKEH